MFAYLHYQSCRRTYQQDQHQIPCPSLIVLANQSVDATHNNDDSLVTPEMFSTSTEITDQSTVFVLQVPLISHHFPQIKNIFSRKSYNILTV